MITTLFRGLHVHLVGIGGAGVSALAPLLARVGAVVSGCDCHAGPITEKMAREGITIHHGHDATHMEGVDVVVHTAAVKIDHPELAEATRRGVRVMTRGECLVELMRGTRTLAVAGSHGKTSTSWMLGHILTEGGLDPVVMVGGSVASLGGGARVGVGRYFVAETDESDGSFARVDPYVAIVTNLDGEHLDHWGSFDALEKAFHTWLARIPADGAVIIPTVGLSPAITAGISCRVVRCGLDAGDVHGSHIVLGPDSSRLQVHAFGIDLGEIVVPIPGAHMVLNALMAIAAARIVSPNIDVTSLGRCERVRRRFTVHGVVAGVRVVEDYGHHPAEVRATIAAASLAGGRVHVIFQPHRYTRTRDCFAEFTASFAQASSLALLPIYAASEEPISGVSSERLAAAVSLRWSHRGIDQEAPGQRVTHSSDGLNAVACACAQAHPGDTVLILGAGDVGELASKVVDFFTVLSCAQTFQPTHSFASVVR